MSREPLVPHDAAQTLAAGGIVGKGAKLPAEERTTVVSARTYHHPALPPDRVIVRLEPAAVAEGTDAEMAAFLFSEPEVGPQLGEVRYRTLGFPAWGLVNAPKAGKVALGVMEDVRKAKRLVAAKPGHAKEAFEKIAKTLQKASPQLLPSFWEEVGRTVADLASAALAAQCFERARQAERAFKLKIDPDDSDAVFLEFALLGALSAKTLGQYAKDLAASDGGAQAYKRFRTIAVKRALGGMTPWAGMGKDLRSLAKAAKLDLVAEDDALLTELLDTPAISKSPGEFWTTYHDSFVRLGKRDGAMRDKLRNLWPKPHAQTNEAREAFREQWIALLDEVGALQDLPDKDLGAWISRLIGYVGDTPRVVALLTELAPRLATQPIEVQSPRGRWSGLSLDLAEKALELGIPLAEPDGSFDTDTMTVDPVRVSVHPVYGPKLVEAVDDMIGNADAEARMRGKPGFDKARATWIEERFERLAAHPINAAAAELDLLEQKTTAQSFLAFPALYERLRAIDLSAALALQLRGGLVDEFTWPAYEAAAKKFDGPVKLGGAFPVLTIWDKTKAIAVGGSGVVGEHDLVYKDKEHGVDYVLFLGDQFLVELDPVKGYGNVGYWSSAPKTHFELKGIQLSHYGHHTTVATTLSDGSITLSGKASFRVGDVPKQVERYTTDGVRFWANDYRAPDGLMFEYDPIKGAKLGSSLPEFYAVKPELAIAKADGTPGAWALEKRASTLMVAPAGYASSPLGIGNGLAGQRVYENDVDDKHQLTRTDGVTMISTGRLQLVTFPGDPSPRQAGHDGVDNDRFMGGDGPGIELYIGDDSVAINKDDWAARGWAPALVPALPFWHMFVARDLAASTRLRAATTEQARALLAVAAGELAGEKSGRSTQAMAKTTALVIETFGVTDPALARGIVGIVEYAAEQAARIAPLATERAKENADASGTALSTEGMFAKKVLAALVAGRETKFKDFELDLDELLGAGRGQATLALSPLGEADDRRNVRDRIRTLLATPFIDDVSQLRFIPITEPDGWENPDGYDTASVTNQEASTFIVCGYSNWAIELSRDGKHRLPPPWVIEKTEAAKAYTPFGSEWARTYLEQPDEPVPWDPEIAIQLAAKSGLSVPEATLLYLGMPSGWSKDFLGKAKRDIVGLKMGEADAARTTFQPITEDDKKALYNAAAPSDPALLRTPLAPGGFVEGLARAWKAKFGKQTKVPQDLIVALKKDFEDRNIATQWLPAFTGTAVPYLEPDRRPIFQLERYGGSDNGLTIETALTVATLASWLFHARPVGDPIRARLGDVVAKIKTVFDDPTVLFYLSEYYGGDTPAEAKKIDGLFSLVGGKPIEVPAADNKPATRAFDNGAVVIAQYEASVWSAFRPAKVSSARKQIDTLYQATLEEYETYDPLRTPATRTEMFTSDGFAAFIERMNETPVPEGGYEMNPAQSVPKLVAKVAKAKDLSTEAATLFLQVLALAEPTERNVQLYNGWTAKQYKAAAAEVAKKKLVVEGKRERAGRSIFVKGAYSKGRGKDLPMEDWKQPYYGMLERNSLPAEPIHLVFAKAWKRYEDGE